MKTYTQQGKQWSIAELNTALDVIQRLPSNATGADAIKQLSRALPERTIGAFNTLLYRIQNAAIGNHYNSDRGCGTTRRLRELLYARGMVGSKSIASWNYIFGSEHISKRPNPNKTPGVSKPADNLTFGWRTIAPPSGHWTTWTNAELAEQHNIYRQRHGIRTVTKQATARYKSGWLNRNVGYKHRVNKPFEDFIESLET
jgi:hypothetical protein